MKIINNKICMIYAAYMLLFTFCFSAALLWGEPEFGKPKIEGVLPGVAISWESLTQRKSIPKVWKNDDYRIEKIMTEDVQNLIVIIRKWWAKGKDQLDITMAVGTTPKAAERYLAFIKTFCDDQEESNLEDLEDCKFELVNERGFCFAAPGKKKGTFLSIHFTFNNIAILMRAEGSLTFTLKEMAVNLVHLLEKKETVPCYSQLEDIPWVTLSCKKTIIDLRESLPLTLNVKNKCDGKLRFFWELTGGGVEEDPKGNFFYYAGDLGKQTITVTVVNELGLHHSDSVNIIVSQ